MNQSYERTGGLISQGCWGKAASRALSRGTHSEEREYGHGYSKRDSAVNIDIGDRLFQQHTVVLVRDDRCRVWKVEVAKICD
jgi:hypothetical protein